VSADSQTPDFRSGFVSLVGRPSTGKSTLVNAAAGQKISIVSDRPQTTRTRIRAIIDRPDCQMVIVDTPGIHKPIDSLGGALNKLALQSLSDADVVCFVIDASQPVGRGDEWIARHVSKSVAARKMLVITKTDLVSQAVVEAQIAASRRLLSFDDAIVVSAVQGFNIEGFLDLMRSALPVGPRYFPQDMSSDQPLEVMIAEFIREKILRSTFDEVPHATGVIVEEFRAGSDDRATRIEAIIFVERDSQKGILIGKGGEGIKRIGTEARIDLERLLGTTVFLGLRVKVKSKWRNDPSSVRRFGYGDGSG